MLLKQRSNFPKHPDLILWERAAHWAQGLRGNPGQGLQVHLWSCWSTGWECAAHEPIADGQPSAGGLVLEHPSGSGIKWDLLNQALNSRCLCPALTLWLVLAVL